MCGGVCLTPEYMHQVRRLADQYGLMIHLDGARIFNAAVALGVDVTELVCDADSVSFCLSKGLAAPIGSLVCGSRDFIKAARRVRKVVGGGTRQAGIIAAAGIVALEQMVDRLAEDHANARLLADGLANMPGITLDPTRVQTNLVFFEVAGTSWTAAEFCERLAALGVLMLPLGRYTVRAVTHYGIERADVEHALHIVAQLLKG